MKKQYRFTIMMVMLLAAAVISASCSNGDKSEPKTNVAGNQAAVTEKPAAAKEKVLKVRYYDDPAGFDPATVFRIENETITFNIFSGLVTYDSKTAKIIPDLAEKWETEGNKIWTFHLRKGVKWQKGYGELTSADVLYTYKRILDPATGSPYVNEFANIESIEAPDDYTVVYKLKSADGNFLHVVANYHQGQIVKKEAIEKAGENVKWEPVGTGPFQLESINPNSEIILTRHDDYFMGPAPLSKIVFSIIKNDETAAIALQNGEVDLAMRIGQQESLERLEAAGFKMNHLLNRAISLKVFNTTVKPLDDVRVRHAWAYAVDWKTIRESLEPMLGGVAYNLLPDWMDVYTDDVPKYEYNPEKAKQLLAEAGYPNGFKITQLASTVDEAAQLEQEYLKAVGIQLDFEIVDSPTSNKRRNDGDFQVAGRLLPAVNPDMILFSYLHPDNFPPKGLNGARYNNPVLTAKLEAARAETDPGKRKQLYKEVQQIAMTDLPYLPTTAAHVYYPSYDYVKNVNINMLSQVGFYEIDMTDKGK